LINCEFYGGIVDVEIVDGGIVDGGIVDVGMIFCKHL